jgi:hypothetical protein
LKKKGPGHWVKRSSYIDFEQHAQYSPRVQLPSWSLDELATIMDEATFYKSVLANAHQLTKLGRQSVRQHFRYELAKWVNEGIWTVIPNRRSLYWLGEENHEGIIHVAKMSHVKALEHVESRHEIMSDHQPGDLEEAGSEAIRTGCFV